MLIDVVWPKFSPPPNGVGDHTLHLIDALDRRGQRVRLLTRRGEARKVSAACAVQEVFGRRAWSYMSLPRAAKGEEADWLLLQFTQFAYGKWGINPYLPLAIGLLKGSRSKTKVALLAHEIFSPRRGGRSTVMSLIQQMQFFALGRLSDVVFLSTPAWIESFGPKFPPGKLKALPIASNIPVWQGARRDARIMADLSDDDMALLVFGGLGPDRDLAMLVSTLAALQAADPRVIACYIGADGAVFEAAMRGVGVRSRVWSSPSADVVARTIAACDVALSFYIDGASLRRGGFLACLAQGIATVATKGEATDAALKAAAAEGCFLLVPVGRQEAAVEAVQSVINRPDLGRALSQGAQRYYQENHSWDSVCAKLLDPLQEIDDGH